MQKTNIRQQTILDILKAGPVYSQDELSQRLQETGIQTTQATHSRDLKALKISKVPGEGYVLPAPHAVQPPAADLPGGVVSIEFSGTLAVIKTQPGFANAIAFLIDHRAVQPVIGTVAGDDTVLAVLRTGVTPGQALEALSTIIPDIKQRQKYGI